MRSSAGIPPCLESRPASALQARVLMAVLVTVAALLVGHPSVAGAAPTTPAIEQKRREAAAAQERLDELAAQLELRAEEYAEVVEELGQTRAKVAETRDALDRAREDLEAAQSALSDRASRIYRTSDVGFMDVLFGIRDFSDFLSWLDYMRHLARSDARTVSSVRDAVENVERTERALEEQEARQTALRERARASRAEVQKAVRVQRSYLKGLNAEVATMVREESERQARLAAERARRAAEAAAAAARAAAERARAVSAANQRRFDPGTLGSGHPEVVAIGLQYLGVPYVWGGTSPESGFDCSGLTQYAYAKAGIDIPRTSRSQFVAGSYIAPDRIDLLQAGDLVFFGYEADPGRIHHVGIYVGGGDYLHAPQTGQPVQVSSLTGRIASRGDYVGGSRY